MLLKSVSLDKGDLNPVPITLWVQFFWSRMYVPALIGNSPVSFSLNLCHPFHLHRYCYQQAWPCKNTRNREVQTGYSSVLQKPETVHGPAGHLSTEHITIAPEE